MTRANCHRSGHLVELAFTMHKTERTGMASHGAKRRETLTVQPLMVFMVVDTGVAVTSLLCAVVESKLC